MNSQRDVWVYVEQTDGRVADVSLELLSKGRELADQIKGQVCAVLCGSQVKGLADVAIHNGADRVLLADHAELEVYRTVPYARIISGLVKARNPYIFLYGATSQGRDLAPRVASAVRAGLTADCTDLQIGDYTNKVSKRTYRDLLYQIRPAFGGNLIATIVNPEKHPQMASVREGVMRRMEPDRCRRGVVEDVEVFLEPQDLALQVLKRESCQTSVNLKEAAVIVAGGAGVRSKQDFSLLADLANLMGGQVGASRAAVDAGYAGHEHQVGQTGVTVRPRLYIAAGISGAVQHRAGMAEANKIIAINTDPDAPIFQIADYKIVGDLAEVVPMMIAALRDRTR